MPYLPRLASGALCDCIALRWQFYLPVLSECEYERGNVRRDMKGESTLMDTDAADAIPQGRRQQRRGLVYDPSFTSGEASPYAPKASPRVWPNERSRSRMGLVPGALYCRSAAPPSVRVSRKSWSLGAALAAPV